MISTPCHAFGAPSKAGRWSGDSDAPGGSAHAQRETPMYVQSSQQRTARRAKTSICQLMRGLRRLQPTKRKACAARA
eukprot:7003563-Prymnesium_polylepis.1